MIFAQKPPMGWNAWNYFGYADINEQVVRETADAMVEKGFRDAGYNIVQVDDAWLLQKRDENGDLQPNPERFPSGMKSRARNEIRSLCRCGSHDICKLLRKLRA